MRSYFQKESPTKERSPAAEEDEGNMVRTQSLRDLTTKFEQMTVLPNKGQCAPGGFLKVVASSVTFANYRRVKWMLPF